MSEEEKRYWHELSDEEVKEKLEWTVYKVNECFKRPDWCTYLLALTDLGCLKLIGDFDVDGTVINRIRCIEDCGMCEAIKREYLHNKAMYSRTNCVQNKENVICFTLFINNSQSQKKLE